MIREPLPFDRSDQFIKLLVTVLPRLSMLLIMVALMGVGTNALAHDANFATVKIIRQPSNSWVFELHTPLHGLDKAMRQFRQESVPELDDLKPDSKLYKEWIVRYVESGFDLRQRAYAAGESASPDPSLGAGRMKLGEHTSVLIFKIEDMPETLAGLILRLPYMSDNPGQHNVLWLVDGERRQRHLLRADNDYAVGNSDFFSHPDKILSE